VEVPKCFLSTLKVGFFSSAQTGLETALLAGRPHRGLLTGDVVGYDKRVKTSEYTKAVIKNLGRKAEGWKVRTAKPIKMPELSRNQVFRPAKTKEVVGADIFVESAVVPAELGPSLEAISEGTPLKLKMISNRGTKVYPDGNPNIDCVSQHRCRFMDRSGQPIQFDDALALSRKINETHEVCHIERLLRIDGADGFTKAQGED
jgi:isocitrate dehydrogenase